MTTHVIEYVELKRVLVCHDTGNVEYSLFLPGYEFTDRFVRLSGAYGVSSAVKVDQYDWGLLVCAFGRLIHGHRNSSCRFKQIHFRKKQFLLLVIQNHW